MNKIISVLLIILILGLIGLAYLLLETRNSLDKTHNELVDTKSQIIVLASQLEQTKGRLDFVEASLVKNQNELADTKNELSRTVGKLSELQDSLDDLFQQITKFEYISPLFSSTHYDKVNEAFPDDDISYIENKNGAPDTWQRDLFTIPDHINSGEIIESVSVFVRTIHNVSSVKACVKTYNTLYEGKLIDTSLWTTRSYTWNTNPYTSNAWTWEEINDLEIGVALSGTTASPDWSRCTQVYAEVAYSIGAVQNTLVFRPNGDGSEITIDTPTHS